jgi:hypothetical protein
VTVAAPVRVRATTRARPWTASFASSGGAGDRTVGGPAGTRWAVLCFAGACVLALILRAWVLAAPGAPPGVDGGNWLAFGQALLGSSPRSASLMYPPVVPILVSTGVDGLGPTLGVAAVAALGAVAPAIGVFFVLRWSGLGWRGAVLASFLLPASAIGEEAAWGAYPQLLAAPLILCSLWLLDRWLRGGEPRALVGAAVAGALVAAVSHFAALFGTLAALAIAVCHLSTMGRGRRAMVLRRAAAGTGLVGVFALPLASTYVRLIDAAIASRGAEPSLATIGFAELPGRFVDVHGAAWPIWAIGAVAATTGVVLLRERRRHPLWTVNAGFAAALVGTFLITREPRVLHEVPTMAVLGLGLWVRRLGGDGGVRGREKAGAAAAALALSLALVTVVGIRDFSRQRDAYAVLDGDLVQALEWIRDETPEGSLVAVSSAGDAPLGWWVEGLTRRPVLYSAPLRWLSFPEERVAAAQANHLFLALGMPTREGMQAAEALGVDYVLLAKAPPAYDSDQVRSYLGSTLPAFENGSALILRVGQTDRPEGSVRREAEPEKAGSGSHGPR